MCALLEHEFICIFTLRIFVLFKGFSIFGGSEGSCGGFGLGYGAVVCGGVGIDVAVCVEFIVFWVVVVCRIVVSVGMIGFGRV